MIAELKKLWAAIDELRRNYARIPVRWPIPGPAPVSLDNGGGPDGGCGCCNAYDCVDDLSATIGACPNAPNGAPNQYLFNPGIFTGQSQFGGSQIVTWDSGCVWLGPPMVYITRGNWAPSTFYFVDDTVRNGGHSYICTGGGTSASSGGPTGGGTGIMDGTATWDYTL